MTIPGCLRQGVLLAEHSTLRIGGPARWFAEPTSIDECVAVRRFAKREKIPCISIGRGSNLLFDDRGFDGVVLKLAGAFSGSTVNDARSEVSALAGTWLPAVARTCQLAGLAGVEHTAGIPGGIGGALVMNAGSKGHGIGEVVMSATVADPSGELHKLDCSALGFRYRASALQERLSGWTVLSVGLRLTPDDPSRIRSRMLEVLRDRGGKFPRKEPNCGSVFKRNDAAYPVHGPPGRIIEHLGFKGKRRGSVWVSTLHANFIVNGGNAKASDFLGLMAEIQAEARRRLGVELEPEVQVIPSSV